VRNWSAAYWPTDSTFWGNFHSHTDEIELLHTSPSRDKTARLRVQKKKKKCVFFYRWEFTYFIFPFRFTQVLGDTINIPLFGMLPMYLLSVCFDSLSAITVKYFFQLLTVTACYIPQRMSVCVYHYIRYVNASLRSKLWISNMICISIIIADILSLQPRICNLTKFSLSIVFPLTPGGNEQLFSIHSSLVLRFLGKRFKSCTCLFHLWNS